MRVLLAEDHPAGRDVLREALEDAGHEVVVVSDGLQAWDILRDPNCPRLVISNWGLPGLSGVDLCRKVRRLEHGGFIYMIMLTGRTEPNALSEAMGAGFDDFLPKSASLAELKARVQPAARIDRLWQRFLSMQFSLAQQARHDILTGLENRVSLLGMLESEFARSARESGHLAAIMIDMDHFRGVNDTYGRRVGDAVLTEVAARLRAVVRPYDLLGRYGEEEFLVIAPGCDLTTAGQLADRLRRAVGADTIAAYGRSVSVTVSAGVASVVAGGDSAPEALLDAAEEALTRAKSAGRNQVFPVPLAA